MSDINRFMPGSFYQARVKRGGLSIEVHHGGDEMTPEFLEFVNKKYNNADIYIDYYDITRIGGMGGPGGSIIDIINSPDFPLQIYIGQLLLDMFSSFAYDVLKEAVITILKKVKTTPGNHKVEIHHQTKIVVFNFNIEKTTDDDIDLQLKTLLSGVVLEEAFNEDPEMVNRILDKFAKG